MLERCTRKIWETIDTETASYPKEGIPARQQVGVESDPEAEENIPAEFILAELGIPLLLRPSETELRLLWQELDVNQTGVLNHAFFCVASMKWGDGSWIKADETSALPPGENPTKMLSSAAKRARKSLTYCQSGGKKSRHEKPPQSTNLLSKKQVTWEEVLFKMCHTFIFGVEPYTFQVFREEFIKAGSGNHTLTRSQSVNLASRLLERTNATSADVYRVVNSIPNPCTFEMFLRLVGPSCKKFELIPDKELHDKSSDTPAVPEVEAISLLKASQQYRIPNLKFCLFF